jgi:hypothetical protein
MRSIGRRRMWCSRAFLLEAGFATIQDRIEQLGSSVMMLTRSAALRLD